MQTALLAILLLALAFAGIAIKILVKKDGELELVFPDDPAAGADILLSDMMANKYISHGSPYNRITWVRLKGVVANIYVYKS